MTGRRKPIARPLEALLAVLTLGVVTASALALFAESFWVLELLTHFRLQLLIVQLPLMLACLWFRRWLLFTLIAPFSIVHATAVAPYWPREASVLAAPDAVELMVVNLYGRNDEHARFIELADTEQPDLLLLLELTPEWAVALKRIEAGYPHRLVDARNGVFGIALFSRVPLIDPKMIEILGVPAIDTRLDLGHGDPVRLIGVHFRPPMSARQADERNAQLDRVGDLVVAESGPMIVAGDFNVTPYSPVFGDWIERTVLSDSRRGRGFGMSWPTSLPILGVPIDHVLISEDFLVNAHYYGPAFGSDHYPVVTRLSLRGEK